MSVNSTSPAPAPAPAPAPPTIAQINTDLQNLETTLNALYTTQANYPLSPTVVAAYEEVQSKVSNLYRDLNSAYTTRLYAGNVDAVRTALNNQIQPLNVITDQTRKAENNLKTLKQTNLEKNRVIQINDYYSSRYSEHAEVMKIIIYTLLPIIILTYLYNKGIIPNRVYIILIAFIVIIGGIFMYKRIGSILMRNNMNYDQYDWKFYENRAPKINGSGSSIVWDLPEINPCPCLGAGSGSGSGSSV
jgi:hypothetical protein